MNHPEAYTGRLTFDAADPYASHAYLILLNTLLEADDNDPTVPGRVRDLEEVNRVVLGDRLAKVVTAQAVLDEWDIRHADTDLIY